MTFFNGERCGSGRLGVRLDGFAVCLFAVDQTTVATCVPFNGQRDGRAAIVADTIRVGIYMVGVLFTACLADGTGFRALVLGIAYA